MFALLGPNGSGKTTTVHILSTLLAADAGDVRIDGHDVVGDPDGVRGVIGVTGQFSAIDGLLSGRENLMLMADLHHLPRARRARPRAGAARAVRPRRRGRQAGRDLLGRDEAPARPGHDARRQPARDLPRRADHGPGPAQPAHDVGGHPRAGGARRDDLPDHAVPRRGRRARGPDRGARPRHDRRLRHAGGAQAPPARAATSACASPTRTSFAAAQRAARRARTPTRRRSRCRCRATAPCRRCARSSPSSTSTRSSSTTCPSTPPTSTTSSSPSPDR